MTRTAHVALVAALLFSCEEPALLEVNAACHNGLDDDGDGQLDCDDPSCDSSCERSSIACSNGEDDDGDGAVDCESEGCRAAGFCEPRPQECDLFAQTGCARGLSCFPLGGAGAICALPGTSPPGAACGTATDCVQPAVCADTCATVCRTHADCPRAGACLRVGSLGYCLAGCVPSSASSCGGRPCLPLEGSGWGDSYAACFPRNENATGTAPEGAPCDELPAPTEVARRCAPRLLCRRSAPSDAPVCRSTCGLDPQTGAVVVRCQSASVCKRVFNDARPAMPGTLDQGICDP